MPTAESPQPIRAHLNTRSGHHSARTLLTEVPTDGGVPTAPMWRNELAPDSAVQVPLSAGGPTGGCQQRCKRARTEAAPVQDGWHKANYTRAYRLFGLTGGPKEPIMHTQIFGSWRWPK